MKSLAALSFVVVLCLAGCGTAQGTPGSLDPDPGAVGETIKVEFSRSSFCCDPNDPSDQEIGTLRLTHLEAPNKENITVDIGKFTNETVVTEAGVPTKITLEPGDVFDIKLYAAGCDWDAVVSTLSMEGTGRLANSTSRRLVVNNACGPLGDLFFVVEGVLPNEDEVGVVGDSALIEAIGEHTFWSGPQVAPKIPSFLWTEINRRGVFPKQMLIDMIVNAFGDTSNPKPGGAPTSVATFPCGAGPNGYTVCPAMPLAMAAGDYLFAYLSVEEDIPLSSSRLITYGFVFDTDGDTSNNYVPHPSYPDDFFKDSDRWYTVEYAPGTGWTLICRDATNSVISEVPTAARAIISGNCLLLVVPRSEFAVPDPSYRVTAFTHTGDFGANPPHDWSGDQHPRVSEGLAPFLRGY